MLTKLIKPVLLVMTLFGAICLLVTPSAAVQDTSTNANEHPPEHVWIDATCISPKHCAYCAETQGNPRPHKWSISSCHEPQKCKYCGTTQGTPRAHRWMRQNPCDERVICKYCGSSKHDIEGRVEHQIVKTNCTTSRCTICGIDLKLEEPQHSFPKRTLFNHPRCLDCGRPDKYCLLTYLLLPITASLSCLDLIAALLYLIDYKLIRKY